MTTKGTQKTVCIIGVLGLLVLLSAGSYVFLGNDVCFAPDAYYVADRKDVLSISGTTVSHARLGLFTVDDPPITNKVYKGEGNSTLVFTHEGDIGTATITIPDGAIKRYFFYGYGSVAKKKIVGIYGPIGKAVEFR